MSTDNERIDTDGCRQALIGIHPPVICTHQYFIEWVLRFPDAGSEDGAGWTGARRLTDVRIRPRGDREAIKARSAVPASLAACDLSVSVSICGSIRLGAPRRVLGALAVNALVAAAPRCVLVVNPLWLWLCHVMGIPLKFPAARSDGGVGLPRSQGQSSLRSERVRV